MQSFFELTTDQRFKVYDAIDALECKTHQAGGSGFLSVALAKGKFGQLCETFKTLGLAHVDLYKFPLGSDLPPAHLRHESRGIPDSCWLIATFRPY